MLKISNVTQDFSVNIQIRYDQGGVPTQMSLRPGVSFLVMDEVFKQYSYGVKQDIAAMISKAMLKVNHSDEVHTYFDQDHAPSYAQDCAQAAGADYCIARDNIVGTTDGLHWDDAVTGLQTAIDAFIDIRDNFSGHVTSIAYHTVVGVASAATDPTDLPSLIIQLGTLRTEYNTHIIAVAQHPNADSVNDVPVPALVTLEDCVLALRTLNHNFGSHRMQYLLSGTTELTPIQIITDNYGNVTPVPPTPGSVTQGGGVSYQGSSESEAGDFKVDWASAISLDLSNLPFPVVFENFIGIYEYDDDNLISTYIPEDLTYDWTWVPGADTSTGTITLNTATFDAASKFVVLLRGPEKDFLDVMSDFGGPGVHQSPRDFAAVWASATTLNISGMVFDPDTDGIQIRAVVEIVAGGRATVTYTRHEWAFSWVAGAAGAGVLTIASATMQATSKFIVFIEGPEHNTKLLSDAGDATKDGKIVQHQDRDGGIQPAGDIADRAVHVQILSALAMMNGDNIYKSPIHFSAVYQAPTAIDLAGHPTINSVGQFHMVVQISSANVWKVFSPLVGSTPFSWSPANNRLTIATATFTGTDIFVVVIEGTDRFASLPSNHQLFARTNSDRLVSDDVGVELLGTPLVLTVNWQDVGPRIHTLFFSMLALGLTIDINLSTGLEFRALSCFSQAGVEEYSGIIETPYSNVIKVHPAHFEDDTNVDKLIVVPIELLAVVPFAQVQARVQVVGGTAAELDYVEYIRGWGA